MLKGKLHVVKKIQYLILASVIIILLLRQVSKSVHKFHEQKTGTTDLYESNSKVAFPELTICSRLGYKAGVLLQNGIKNEIDYFYLGQWSSNESQKDPEQLFDEITYELEELVHQVIFYTEDLVNGENLIKLKPREEFCSENLFQIQFFFTKGKCFTLKTPSCIHQAGIMKIRIQHKQNLTIWVHYPGQFLSPNSKIKLEPELGHVTNEFVHHENVQLLNISDKCVHDYHGFNGFDDCLYNGLR